MPSNLPYGRLRDMTEHNDAEAVEQLTNKERYDDTSLTAEVDDEALLESFEGFGGDDE